MKVAIVGGRDFNNYDLLKSKINEVENTLGKISLIVSGGAKGADTLGEKYANEKNIPTKIFKPNWEKYGKSAGMIRNKKIVENADIVIAFWDGKSKGTKDSIDFSKKIEKKLLVFGYNVQFPS